MARYAKKTNYKGIQFDSQTECDFYKRLENFKKRGLIKDFKTQVKYVLQEKFKDWRGESQREITHLPDFSVTLNDDTVILVDSKGGSQHETEAKIKRKMLLNQNRDMPYYFISYTPNYLGNIWVESSTGHDLNKKLKTLYKKKYPVEAKKKGKKNINFSEKEIHELIEIKPIANGLFYTY